MKKLKKVTIISPITSKKYYGLLILAKVKSTDVLRLNYG